MNDPHVQAVYYNLRPREGVIYKNPPPIIVAQSTFDGELRDNRFVANMTQHFPTTEEARVSIDAFLRSWEITASLERGYPEFRFEYDRCDIIDRDPSPPGTIRGHAVTAQGRLTLSGTATVSVTCGSYPEPRFAFAITPLVEMLWNRYMRFTDGNEPLFSMAYFCLTALERSIGGRRQAAAKYNIKFDVLSKIGELSSTRGSATDARKITNIQMTPATASEQEWLKRAVQSLILQIGSVEAGIRGHQLDMALLPKL